MRYYKLQITNHKRAGTWLASVICTLSLVIPCSAQQIEARINRVGLFAGSEPAVRTGAWSFADVGLRYSGSAPFDGELRVDQLDQDGDVATSVLKIALAPGAEWRDYQVYYVPSDVNSSGNRVTVRLYDARTGRKIDLIDASNPGEKELISTAVSDIPADDLLIIDLTVPRKLPHVSWLDSSRQLGRAAYINARMVRPMSPQELPQRWQGLEPVDAIVWDDADPSALSAQQIDALLDWVRAGGRLLLSAGKNWQLLANSPLAAELPVTLTGLETRDEALEFLEIVEQNDYEAQLDGHYRKNPINRAVGDPRPGCIPVPAKCAIPQIVHRRMLGRGVITLVEASLEQLLPIPKALQSLEGGPENFGDKKDDKFVKFASEKVVGRRLLGLPIVEEDANGGRFLPGALQYDLFTIVRQTIAFESVGARFLIVAIFFAVCYTLAATWGSNRILRRRSMQHHAWTGFAVVAIAFCAIGFGMVWALRGVTTKLWQTTIIDAQSANDHAQAQCLFGVRTPKHAEMNLRLPIGNLEESAISSGPLHVLPEGQMLGEQSSKFAAPENYRCDSARNALTDIPIRATLKEFQGAWRGHLSGTFDGKLVALENKTADKDAIPYEFGEGSYLRNNLPIDLKNCYLIETEEETAGDRPVTLARCYFVADLPAGYQLQGEELRSRLFYKSNPNDSDIPPKRIDKMPRLMTELRAWANKIPSFNLRAGDVDTSKLEGELDYYSMLLLSFFDLIRHKDLNINIRRGHGRTLDCSRQLTRTTAILIGYSQEPAPPTLEANLVSLRPSKARTMYRFLIPVERAEKSVE